MNIKILELIDGAKAAKGLTVIIDVFRAMTVEAYVIQNGAANLIPISSVEEAYAYREAHPGTLLMGERGGAKCPGFDFGNSPSQVAKYWTCAECGTENSMNYFQCKKCGQYKS